MRAFSHLTTATLALMLGSLTLEGAQAQSNSKVEIFGRMDLGIVAFKGINAGTVTTVSSGNTGSSALGFRGEEDLGHGYKAVFVLEHGFYADTGDVSQGTPLSGTRIPDYVTAKVSDPGIAALAQNNLGEFLVQQIQQPFWGQQAMVGLITPFGAFLGGRTYSPAYEVFDRYDPMESGNVADPYTLLSVPVGLEVRVNRSVQYRIEAQGWTGALTWGAQTTEGYFQEGRFYGLALGFENDTFSLGIGHQARQNSLGETSLVNNVVGAWYKTGPFKLMGSYTTAKDQNPQGGKILEYGVKYVFADDPDTLAAVLPDVLAVAQQLQVDSRVMSLGVQYQATPQLRLIANHAQLRDGKLAEGDASLWGAAAEYALSKRTSLWASVAQINNQAEQQIAPMTSGTLRGFSSEPGRNTSALQLNVSHKF
jgi:predicted porin